MMILVIPSRGFHLRMRARPASGRPRPDAGWPRSLALTLAALLLCAVFAASRAEANAGPPIYYSAGKIAAEPSGLKGVAISHETLHIDMRGLPVYPRTPSTTEDSPEIRNPIEVSVTYSITNRGPAREVALIFASGAPATAGFSVTLDGRPIAAQPAMSVTLPAEWMPPATTPGLEGGNLLYLDPPAGTYGAAEAWYRYPRTPVRSLTSTYAFTVTIPMRESVLAVHYQAEPQLYLSSGYIRTLNSYQFAYVLAPARAWDGFGGLDVTVSLPACWLAASRPELARTGDELAGSFDAVPADALAFTVAPCESAKRNTPRPCGTTGLILPLAALGFVLYRRARHPV